MRLGSCQPRTVRAEWRQRVTVFGALAMVGGSLCGCGSDSPFSYVPISGKVTYDDGSPVMAGRLQFEALVPPQGKAHPRPATASIKADGTFDAVTSHKHGDGLVRGKHKVAIIFAIDAEGRSLVAQEYTNTATTPLVVDTADAPLHIEVRRP